MTIANWLTIAGMFVTLLLAGIGGLVWIVAKNTRFETLLEVIQRDVSGMKAEVSSFTKNCFTNEEANVRFAIFKKESEAQWSRVDACKKWIRHLFFKAGENLDDKDF